MNLTISVEYVHRPVKNLVFCLIFKKIQLIFEPFIKLIFCRVPKIRQTRYDIGPPSMQHMSSNVNVLMFFFLDLLMEVSVRYRSETVANATVCAGKGCYVYFESLNAIADSQGMTKIALPNSKSVNYQTPQKSEKLLEFTNRILYNMKHG